MTPLASIDVAVGRSHRSILPKLEWRSPAGPIKGRTARSLSGNLGVGLALGFDVALAATVARTAQARGIGRALRR